MKYVKLTSKKSNNQLIINFDKVTHIENKGEYCRVTLDKFGFHFFDVTESLEHIETEIQKK